MVDPEKNTFRVAAQAVDKANQNATRDRLKNAAQFRALLDPAGQTPRVRALDETIGPIRASSRLALGPVFEVGP